MCNSCRKPPRIIRKPTVPVTPSVSFPNKNKKNSGSGDQRSRITGLTYVPKN